MKVMTREDLLKKEKLTVEEVDLGKNEGVFVRQMTGRERDKFEQSLVSFKENSETVTRTLDDFRAKLAVVTVCDEQGVLLFKPTDYSILSQHMSAKRLEMIVNAAQRLNKISDEDKEALVKNSGDAQSEDSTSD